MDFRQQKNFRWIYRCIALFITITFWINSIVPPSYAQTGLNLPAPGTMITSSPALTPPVLRGLRVDPNDPFHFDFIVDSGDLFAEYEDPESSIKNLDAGSLMLDTRSKELRLKQESKKLIKYFLASLTIPEDDIWVNLSPHEPDRIIPDELGQTEMGRDMLAQDYLLKQLTASLMYPEEEVGRQFWQRIHKKTFERYGTTDIPMDTFHKVWIVPDEAVVYENEASVFVVKGSLKAMVEEDYVAFEQSRKDSKLNVARSELDVHVIDNQKALNFEHPTSNSQHRTIDKIESDILREIILPEIEKEIHHGEHFAKLRQIYHSLILATWFKQKLKKSLLGQIYMDQNKIKGVDIEDKQIKEKIYQQYLAAYKKGVYDYIKEDYNPAQQQMIPRKYFSGGLKVVPTLKPVDAAHLSSFPKPINPLTVMDVRVGNFVFETPYQPEGLDLQRERDGSMLETGATVQTLEQTIQEHFFNDLQHVLNENAQWRRFFLDPDHGEERRNKYLGPALLDDYAHFTEYGLQRGDTRITDGQEILAIFLQAIVLLETNAEIPEGFLTPAELLQFQTFFTAVLGSFTAHSQGLPDQRLKGYQTHGSRVPEEVRDSTDNLQILAASAELSGQEGLYVAGYWANNKYLFYYADGIWYNMEGIIEKGGSLAHLQTRAPTVMRLPLWVSRVLDEFRQSEHLIKKVYPNPARLRDLFEAFTFMIESEEDGPYYLGSRTPISWEDGQMTRGEKVYHRQPFLPQQSLRYRDIESSQNLPAFSTMAARIRSASTQSTAMVNLRVALTEVGALENGIPEISVITKADGVVINTAVVNEVKIGQIESYTSQWQGSEKWQDDVEHPLFRALAEAGTLFELGIYDNPVFHDNIRRFGFPNEYVGLDSLYEPALRRSPREKLSVKEIDIFDTKKMGALINQNIHPSIIVSNRAIKWLISEKARPGLMSQPEHLSIAFDEYPVDMHVHFDPGYSKMQTEHLFSRLAQRGWRVIRLHSGAEFKGNVNSRPGAEVWILLRINGDILPGMQRFVNSLKESLDWEKDTAMMGSQAPTEMVDQQGFLQVRTFNPVFVKRERAHRRLTLAIDLDRTLAYRDKTTGQYTLREGAQEQLKELQKLNISLVLWTHAEENIVKEFFQQYPDLNPLFDLKITRKNWTRMNLDEISGKEHERLKRQELQAAYEAAGLIPADVEAIIKLQMGLLEFLKDITLLNYAALVDDMVPSARTILSKHPREEAFLVHQVPAFNPSRGETASIGNLVEDVLNLLRTRYPKRIAKIVGHMTKGQDEAMLTLTERALLGPEGGIDFKSEGLDLQIQGEGIALNLPDFELSCLDHTDQNGCDPELLAQLEQFKTNFEGFDDIQIMDMRELPIEELANFLGVSEEEKDQPKRSSEKRISKEFYPFKIRKIS